MRGAARPFADHARVRGRQADHRSPADGDRALRQLEPGQEEGRARASALRDPGGAARPVAGARPGVGPGTNRARHRRATGQTALEVPLLAHLRLTHERAAGGRLRRAGGEERLERALEQAVELSKQLGRLPKFADWTTARKADESLMTEWQIYRMFDARRGAWSTFQFLVRERLVEAGVDVAPDGALS